MSYSGVFFQGSVALQIRILFAYTVLVLGKATCDSNFIITPNFLFIIRLLVVYGGSTRSSH
ncbi:hypothetical protein PI125_g5732 [Phytophthora idaei]|nr:hypothetical protein PI125_g5732 [Phytophthora idaei]